MLFVWLPDHFFYCSRICSILNWILWKTFRDRLNIVFFEFDEIMFLEKSETAGRMAPYWNSPKKVLPVAVNYLSRFKNGCLRSETSFESFIGCGSQNFKLRKYMSEKIKGGHNGESTTPFWNSWNISNCKICFCSCTQNCPKIHHLRGNSIIVQIDDLFFCFQVWKFSGKCNLSQFSHGVGGEGTFIPLDLLLTGHTKEWISNALVSGLWMKRHWCYQLLVWFLQVDAIQNCYFAKYELFGFCQNWKIQTNVRIPTIFRLGWCEERFSSSHVWPLALQSTYHFMREKLSWL